MPHKFSILVAIVIVLAGCGKDNQQATTVRVAKKTLVVSSTYDATLEARHVAVVMSGFAGGGVVTELVPEGQLVKRGDVIVRFDDAQPQRDFARARRDAELARLDFETLEKATLPTELAGLEMQVAEACSDYGAEHAYLDDCQTLVKDRLMTQTELDQQAVKVQHADKMMVKIEREYELVKTYTHPSKLARARASYNEALLQLNLASQQVASCSIAAPADGMVVYTPLHLGTDYRTVRVGDTVYKNQPFMAIPDISEWIVTCFVPEVEIARIQIGNTVAITPLAFPDLALTGRVESVSSMAQEVPGSGNWAKHFRVTIAIGMSPEWGARLRSGLSAQARIVAAKREQVLAVPRAVVQWDDGRPFAFVKTANGGTEKRPLQIGLATAAEFEVAGGLNDNEEVILP